MKKVKEPFIIVWSILIAMFMLCMIFGLPVTYFCVGAIMLIATILAIG